MTVAVCVVRVVTRERGVAHSARDRLLALCGAIVTIPLFFFSSRRRHTRLQGDWSSDVCSSDLRERRGPEEARRTALVAAAISRRRAMALDRLDDLAVLAILALHRYRNDAVDRRDEIGRASCRERV